MQLFLAPSIFMAVREEDLVILDAARGEYLMLPAAGMGLRVAPDSNEVTGASTALAEALGEMGALSAPGLSARCRLPAPPTRDLGPGDGSGVTPGDLVRWALAGRDMLGTYWRKPFPEMVASEARAAVFPQDRDRLIPASRTFRTLLPWAPFQGVCLFRSLMLRAFLRRSGLSATWVIGCRTWPFEAHCWLQFGDLVLDDTADHAASFTPLMAVAG